MNCLEAREKLVDLAYGEVSELEELRLNEHLLRCQGCREAYEEAIRLQHQLDRLPKIAPVPGFAEQLWGKLRADRHGRWRRAAKRFLYRHPRVKPALATVVGLVASGVLVWLFSGRLPSGVLVARLLLICAIFWAAAYSLLAWFSLDHFSGREDRLRAEGGLDWFRRVAGVVLSSSFVGSLLALGLSSLGPAAIPVGGGELPGLGVPYRDWAFFSGVGGVAGLASLLLGALLMGGGVVGRPLRHGLLAACLFALVMSPGLSIICVPLTAGLYLSLVGGTALGALGGGSFGYWLRLRVRPSVP